MNRLLTLAIEAAILIAIIGYFIYVETGFTFWIQDYISDETWYVPSARNILIKIFGVQPKAIHDGMVRVTLELVTPANQQDYYTKVGEVKKAVESLGGRIVKSTDYYTYSTDGNYLPAVCADVPPESLNALSEIPDVKQYAVGECYPRAKGILDYMNYEHPPLAKYLIALVLATVGDTYSLWRLAPLAAGVAILVMSYIYMRKIVGGYVGIFLGAALAFVISLDNLFRVMSGVAMLDIFTSAFTYAALLATALGSTLWASIATGLAFNTKFSGAFIALPGIVQRIRDGEKPGIAILEFIYIPVIMLFLVAVPIISYLGFMGWWSNSVEGAIRWHLSIKTSGGGPPVSTPWDWLIGRNAFVLYYNTAPSGEPYPYLVAVGNPYLYLATAALSVFVLPVLGRLADRGASVLAAWGTWLMYVLIWFLGSKTQYSFYMVQVTPLLYTALVVIIFYLFFDPTNIKATARAWASLLSKLAAWLRGEARLRVMIEPVVSGEETGKQVEEKGESESKA